MHLLTADSDPQEIERAVTADEPFWLDVAESEFDPEGPVAHAVGVDADRLVRFARRGPRPAAISEGGRAAIMFAGAVRTADGGVDRVDTKVFVSQAGLLTLRDGPCPPLDDLRASAQAGMRDVDALLVLDALTDSLLDVTGEIEDEVDAVEDRVLSGASEDMLGSLRSLRQGLSVALRLARSQRLLVATAGDELTAVPGVIGQPDRRVRDLAGHLALAADLAESTRQAIGEALDLSLSITSNRLGAAAERLSVIATLAFPATVVTGFFGMNFLWMTDRVQSLAAFLALGVGGVVASVVIVRLYLSSRKLD